MCVDGWMDSWVSGSIQNLRAFVSRWYSYECPGYIFKHVEQCGFKVLSILLHYGQ